MTAVAHKPIDVAPALDAVHGALTHVLQPLAETELPKLDAEGIAFAQVLVNRFIPDTNVQHLLISLLTNPSKAAHNNAIDQLDETSRAVAHVASVMLPAGHDVSSVPKRQVASAPTAAQVGVAPVAARDTGAF